MLLLLFYLIALPVFIVLLISGFVFLRNTLRDLKGEEVFETDILKTLRPAAKSASETTGSVKVVSDTIKPSETETLPLPDREPLEETESQEETVPLIGAEEPQPELAKEDEQPDRSEGPDWATIIEKISTMPIEQEEEAEQFALTYFRQYGAGKISFPQECATCKGKTIPKVLRWKAIRKSPILATAMTQENRYENSLWTVVGSCSNCNEKYILATQSALGVVTNLKWVLLQPDNYQRMLALNEKEISQHKLSFIFRTLPDKSLIASRLTGEWIWLRNGRSSTHSNYA